MNSVYKVEDSIVFLLLTAFISSLIIFDLDVNVLYSNMLNVLLFGVSGFFLILNKSNFFPRNKLASIYFVFTVFCLLSVFWAVDFDLAFDYALRLVIVFVNIVVIYTLFCHYKIQNAILWGVLIGAFFNYLLAFEVYKPSYELYEFGRFLGSVGNPNKLSKILIISIFASLVLLNDSKRAYWIKGILIVNIVLSFYLIFLSVSKKGLIIAPLLVIMSFSYKKIKFSSLIVILILIFAVVQLLIKIVPEDILQIMYEKTIFRFSVFLEGFSGNEGMGDDSTIERKKLIEGGLDLYFSNPIIGVGINNFRVFFEKYAHNNFIELLVGVGIIGATIFYSIYIVILKEIKKMQNSVIKRYFFAMILVLLFMDFTTVSYFDKLVILILVYIYFSSREQKKIEEITAVEP